MMSPDIQLISATLFAILLLIVLIARFRIHPFVALIIASVCLGLLGGLKPDEVIKNFEKGFGDVLSFVGIVIGLGTMLGGLLVTSGGADRLANALVSIGGKRWVPWTIFFAALLIGLPLFFEVGFVLLAPLAFAVARRLKVSIIIVGLPMLAGLSVAHGLVPPHPAPTLAAATFHADIGKTIFLGLLVGLPVGLLSGPAFSYLLARFIRPGASQRADIIKAEEEKGIGSKPPALFSVLVAILLPPVLMMGRSIFDAFASASPARPVVDFLGDPIMALLIALLYAFFVLGVRQGRSLGTIEKILGKSLETIAAVVLIVGAGGGFKQMLLAVHVGDLLSRVATQAHLSPLLLAWVVAALVRVATGSATVATITGAGITAPLLLAAGSTVSPELMVLATGSGSLILSHVNDAGFWLVKEYFGLSLIDTLNSWTAMETLISVLGLIAVLTLGVFVHG
jgi:GntP family gluconate:H+ symporter